MVLKGSLEKSIKVESPVPVADHEVIPLLRSTERILKLVYLEAKSLKSPILSIPNIFCWQYLRMKMLLLPGSCLNWMLIIRQLRDWLKQNPLQPKLIIPVMKMMKVKVSEQVEKVNHPTPPRQNHHLTHLFLIILELILPKLQKRARLDPVVGREREIESLAQILSRRKKNNPVLIGEPGVGKSAIAEGLALRISKKNVSRVLFNKRVVALDLASIVAGTKYRGQFEERMKAILNELSKNDNIILFIDEIHTIVGAGGATGSLDAANMLKPALARGEIQCIGATTLDEYRQHIEKDGALERRFQKVIVEPTSIEETINILHNIKERYEEHHNVIYTDDAIDACVNLTNRYISDRHLPDKAIDALDESGSRVHISNIVVPEKILSLEKQLEDTKKEKMMAVKNQNFEKAASFRDREKDLLDMIDLEKKKWEKELAVNRETVDAEKVAEVVAMMTGVPVQRIAQTEGTRLLKMA